MAGFLKQLMEMEEYRRLIESVDSGISPVAAYGLSESQGSPIVYALFEHIKKSMVIITYNDIEAKKIYEDLSFFTKDVYYLPSKEVLFYNVEAVSSDIASERLTVIKRMIERDRLILITSIDNLSQKYIDPEIFHKYSTKLKIGDNVNLDSLINTFIVSGYERVDMVEGKGQFSIRGGIIDFYPLASEAAFRIELFDDEIDSIREFDPLSQRSLQKVSRAEIFPSREIIIENENINLAVQKISRELDFRIRQGGSKKTKEYTSHLSEKFKSYIEKLNEHIYFEGIDGLLPYLFNRFYTLFDYFDCKPLVIVNEPARVLQRIDTMSFEFQETYENMLQKGEVLASQGELLYSREEIIGSLLANKIVTFNILPRIIEHFKPLSVINFTAVTIHSFQNKAELLIEDLKLWKSRNYRIVILSGTEARGKRLAESLMENDIESLYYEVLPEDILQGQIIITKGMLNKGFEYPTIHFALVSDHEMFGESKHKRRSVPLKGVSRIKSFTDLKVGDYVVHVNHGIGIYQGIKQLTVDGIKKDYLNLRYASGDKLYVPVDQLDLVQKYIGSEGKSPKIYKLGGTEWIKAKTKVKESIKKMADDLVKLYAVRQSTAGHAFSPDTPWQKQFEDEFPYEETPDQLSAIEEIKRDMEASKPMERLLCGDVGYGKTEVALRAAFKAVMDGKQVAFLVPTTILAEQHYNNFVQRFADFPIKVDMVSRFRSPGEQKKTIKALKEGSIDILVGTHRIIQKDIRFKDLGLLIVDEEQRFGVAHKEAIKALKKNVDVLTLSATPIPRTLHMSLLGVRDMSVIETPPEERYPVQTYVIEYNEQLVRDAILREINRGGQVYVVYNRVETIKEMAVKLEALVPEARVAIGHGQMSEHELENIMISFLKGEYDVLLSTTIIENGIDIPNVNTMIVYDADKMGLSQLYQLRGRVGRSNRLAYAYFTYKKDKIISEIAEKRLKAIKEFTEFGSGFKIAMRDLEIRGAGNILGTEQHGHMDAVGYDMYCRLMEEAVRELKGEAAKEPVETSIDLKINAYIDSSFIRDTSQKIEVYKKIAAIRDLQDEYDVEEEIEDRFGTIPEELENLLRIAYLKNISSKIGIMSINQKADIVNIIFRDTGALKLEVIIKLMDKYNKLISFSSSKVPTITIKAGEARGGEVLNLIKEIIETIYSLQS